MKKIERLMAVIMLMLMFVVSVLAIPTLWMLCLDVWCLVPIAICLMCAYCLNELGVNDGKQKRNI